MVAAWDYFRTRKDTFADHGEVRPDPALPRTVTLVLLKLFWYRHAGSCQTDWGPRMPHGRLHHERQRR